MRTARTIRIKDTTILSKDIVAISKVENMPAFRVWLRYHQDAFLFVFGSAEDADCALAAALADWRGA